MNGHDMNFSATTRAEAERIQQSWLPPDTLKSLFTGYRISEDNAVQDNITPVDTEE